MHKLCYVIFRTKFEKCINWVCSDSFRYLILSYIEVKCIYYRMKCIASHASLAGRPGAFSPFVALSNQAMLRARVRMV